MKEKGLTAINIALVLISLILLLNLFGLKLPSLGKAQYLLGTGEPFCFVSWKENSSPLNLDQCCLGAREQLSCFDEEQAFTFNHQEIKLQKTCATGSGEVLKYHLNNRAYSYCQSQVFW